MEKKCPDCEMSYDSSMFEQSQIAYHWYMKCPNGHEYEVQKDNDHDWKYFIPKRPKPNK